MNVQEILVFGAGGFAREVKDVLDAMADAGNQVRCVGFLDDSDRNQGALLNEVPVVGEKKRSPNGKKGQDFLVGIGDPAIKRKIVEKISRHGGKFAKGFNPNAVSTRFVEIGEGTIITAGVIITNRIVCHR